MISNLVKRATLFAGLTEAEQAIIVQHMRMQHFAAHEVIYTEDDASSAFYLIEQGGVRLNVGPISLATLGAGATFGESGVFLGRRRAVSAEATNDTDVWALSRDDLEQLVQENPAIGIKLSRNFGSRIIQVEKYLMNVRLSEAAALSALNAVELQELAAHLELEDFIAGQAIYQEGESHNGFFVLEDGEVQLQQRDGQTQVVKPGDVFGLTATLADSAYEESAIARTEVTAWQLDKDALAEVLAEQPEFLSHLSASVRTALPVSDEELAIARLRALPLFAGLDDDTLLAITRRLVVRPVTAGEIIYKEGDIGDALYLVDKGRVEIVGSVSRKGQVLARLNAGGFFGEMALLTGKARSTGARAAKNTTLWALYRSDFEELATAYPAIGKALSEVLQDRLGKAGHAFIEKHLRLVTLFSGLSVEQLEDVAERLLPARYRGGDIIYKAGSSAARVHIIERGTVELRGPEGILTLKDGDFFGEEAILTGDAHLDTAFARTDGEFWELTREELEKLILKYPIVGLNMSRELSRKLHKLAEQKAVGVKPAPVPVPVPAPVSAQPTRAVVPAAPPPALTPAQPQASKPGMFDSLALWFGGLSRGAKWRLALIILLLVWLLGIAIPATVVNALQSSEASTSTNSDAPRVAIAASDDMAPVAMALAKREATHTPMPTTTYTPIPTNTPIPTDTPTVTPTPTNTPTPTPTDTPTPTPTNTPLPTPTPRPVVHVAAAAPAQPTATPKPATQYSLIEVRRLNPCENRGKHNIYVKVVDANGNGVNGIWVIQAVAGNPGAIIEKRRTEQKDYWLMNPENGHVTFDMFKHGGYTVYISDDGVNPASTDFTQRLDSAFTDEAQCADGGGGNTLFHNSFSVIFRKNW